MRRARKLAGAVVVCLVAAGCGSDQTAAFKSAYVRASGPIESTGVDIARELEAAAHQTDAKITSEFGDLATRFDAELITLEGLKPPPGSSADFAKLTSAANRLDDDLRAISLGAGGHNVPVVRTGLESIVTDGSALNSAAAKLRRELGIS
jgi:hypothetical protein